MILRQTFQHSRVKKYSRRNKALILNGLLFPVLVNDRKSRGFAACACCCRNCKKRQFIRDKSLCKTIAVKFHADKCLYALCHIYRTSSADCYYRSAVALTKSLCGGYCRSILWIRRKIAESHYPDTRAIFQFIKVFAKFQRSKRLAADKEYPCSIYIGKVPVQFAVIFACKHYFLHIYSSGISLIIS